MAEEWWKFTANCPGIEEYSELLFARGISGLHITGEGSFEFYFRGDESRKDSLLQVLGNDALLPIEIISADRIENQNWLKNCRDLWQEIDFGAFKIVPVLEEPKSQLAGDNLYILPGEGFGTGHHAATRMLLQRIIETHENNLAVESMLDVGCGSGILALAAAHLFPTARVLAIDNDPAAVSNAGVNIRLNRANERIVLKVGSLEDVQGKFDLITANIYAEVLIAMQAGFKRVLRHGGLLLMSGIVESLADGVKKEFNSADWELLYEDQQDGWKSLVYRYNK